MWQRWGPHPPPQRHLPGHQLPQDHTRSVNVSGLPAGGAGVLSQQLGRCTGRVVGWVWTRREEVCVSVWWWLLCGQAGRQAGRARATWPASRLFMAIPVHAFPAEVAARGSPGSSCISPAFDTLAVRLSRPSSTHCRHGDKNAVQAACRNPAAAWQPCFVHTRTCSQDAMRMQMFRASSGFAHCVRGRQQHAPC